MLRITNRTSTNLIKKIKSIETVVNSRYYSTKLNNEVISSKKVNEQPKLSRGNIQNLQSKNIINNTQVGINVLARYYSSKPKEISMPALSPTMTEGNIAKWRKNEGDKITSGDVIAEIETDKATMDFQYEEQNGYLAKILVPEGAKGISVNTPIAIIVNKKEDIASAQNYKSAPSAQTTEAPKQEPPKSAPKSSPKSTSSYPKHVLVGLPALSPTMEQGGISKWLKNVGDKINVGEVIAQIETDKATIDFEYQEAGYLAKILVNGGTSGVNVDQPICIVVSKKEDCDKFNDFTVDQSTSEAQPQPQQQPQQATSTSTSTSSPSSSSNDGSRIFISPAAKVAATQKGVDFSAISGTGPNNRIIKSDVLGYTPSVQQQQPQQTVSAPKQQQQTSSSQTFTDIPHSNIRKVTAKRLTESKQQIPHYYLTMECRVDKLLKMRTELNSKSDNKFKLSINDFIIKAASASLRDVPTVNSTWLSDSVRRYHNIDINVAVNTEQGLFTPIIRDSDKRGLASISNAVKALAEKAQANKLHPSEFESGTFTISNLGMFGIKSFSAVINPPQAAILAVGTTETRYVPGPTPKDGSEPSIEQATILSVTLSCDHRVIDGAVGAEWLQKFKDYMENPLKLLL